VPADLPKITGLTSLRLNDNNLVGRLPLALATLPALTESLLLHNHLSGELPAFKSNVVTNYDPDTFCGGGGVKCSTDVSSLLDFLASVGYPQAVAMSWVGDNPCQSWIGVACDPASGGVVSVILQSYGLTGTISPSLANLASLKSLILSKNALSGPVPSELTNVASLRSVDVSHNNLTGPLPLFPSSVSFSYAGNPSLMTAAAPAPVSGASPAPVGGASPAPVGGASPAPVGRASPAPVGGASPAPVGATAPVVAESPGPGSGIPPAMAIAPTAAVPTTGPSVPSPVGGVSSPVVGTVPAPVALPPAPNGAMGEQSRKGRSAGMVPVIGGVLGGVVAVLVAAFLVLLLCRRKKKKLLHGLNGVSIFPRGESGSERDLVKVITHSNSSASHQATVSSYGAMSGSGSSPSNDQQVMIHQFFSKFFISVAMCGIELVMCGY
jgi:hypothetical protein